MGLNDAIVASGSLRRVVPDQACSSRRFKRHLSHQSLIKRVAAFLLTALPSLALLGCQSQNAGAPQGSARAAAPITTRAPLIPGIKTLEIGEQAVKVTKDTRS